VPVVFFILNRLVIGGTAMNTLLLLQSLKQEYTIVLLTGKKETDEELVDGYEEYLEGITHIQIPSLQRSINPVQDYSAYINIKKVIGKYKPSLVYTIGAKPGFLGRLAAAQKKVPVIVHAYHGDVFAGYFNKLLSTIVIKLERYAAAKTTCIITVSKKQQQDLAVIYKIAPPQKLVHIPIGIQTNLFKDVDGSLRQQFRKKYLLKEQEVAIGIVGRIAPIKNHTFFIRLIDQLKKHTSKSLRFFIVGDGERLRLQLEEQLSDLKLDYTYFPNKPHKALVTFTSWQYNMPEVMNGLDIVVLTSDNEGTPVSLLEAQAAGKPVVSAAVGAVAEIVQHKTTGFVYQPGNIEDAALYIESLLFDTSLSQTVGAQGVHFVNAHHNIANQLQQVQHLLGNLLNSSKG
jgi:glycosyltransferase involved in cell wall biosynthesis